MAKDNAVVSSSTVKIQPFKTLLADKLKTKGFRRVQREFYCGVQLTAIEELFGEQFDDSIRANVYGLLLDSYNERAIINQLASDGVIDQVAREATKRDVTSILNGLGI